MLCTWQGRSADKVIKFAMAALLLAPVVLSSVLSNGAVVAASGAEAVWSSVARLGGLKIDHFVEFLVRVRTVVAAPVLQGVVAVCLVMSSMLLFEAVYMSLVSLGVKLVRRLPERRYKWEPMLGCSGDACLGEDVENGSFVFPMVLVQIPMYNEKEVYKLSIGAACALTWPTDRIIVQVLDDSTDPTIKELVQLECQSWACKDINIKYEDRSNRKGYKAGALRKGMEHSYAQQCEFVAIFDADFQPQSDFLLKTIPFLLHNPKIALVQARWDFVNYNFCLMTRIQKMSLDYHFKVEQESGSSVFAFFGFNGTAGVWRTSAINEAGGWKDRTTVEDMDLAIRASLKGWKLLYVGDIKVKSELPISFNAYRRQQHRWMCGAANLFRKMACEVVLNKEVSPWKKFHMLYSFFFIRRAVAPVVTFTFYCIVVPVSVFIPEVSIPKWGLIYVPTTITILIAIRNPSSVHMMPFWILFENVMSMHRMRSAMIGLLEMSNVNEWVVTKKAGANLNEKLLITDLDADKIDCNDRVYFPELIVAVFLLLCATYNVLFGDNCYYIYAYLQAVAFIFIGFGFAGTCSSSSLQA